MKVSHAPATAVTSTDKTAGQEGGEVPGLLEVLAQVADPRKRRGRRFALAFTLAVAVVCVLAGARSFREIGDQAADLPQEVLAAPAACRARCGAGSWCRARSGSGPCCSTWTARHWTSSSAAGCARWRRGAAGQRTARRAHRDRRQVAARRRRRAGQAVRRAAAREGAVIAQHRIPDETTETTQVKALLGPVDLQARSSQPTPSTSAARPRSTSPGRGRPTTSCPSRATRPRCSAPSSTRSRPNATRRPGSLRHRPPHGRVIKRSLWVTGAEGTDFPHVTRVARIRRDRYDTNGVVSSKEVVHAVTSLDADQASAADLAAIARGQWGIESVHWLRDTACAEDANTGYTGNGPQVMATFRNIAVSLLYHAGVTEITRTLQAIGRDRTRMLSYLPL